MTTDHTHHDELVSQTGRMKDETTLISEFLFLQRLSFFFFLFFVSFFLTYVSTYNYLHYRTGEE